MGGGKPMGILDELIKKNEFPIIFIGSGISKRYLKNYPSWLELLEKIWKEIEKYASRDIKPWLIEAYKKIYDFIMLMKVMAKTL